MKNLLRVSFLSVIMLICSHIPAIAHVGYVLTEEEFVTNSGYDLQYLLTPLQNPLYLGLIVATIIAVIGIYLLSIHLKPVLKEAAFIKKEAESYQNLIGWMLRLSLGIALIGAGTTQSLISPVLPANELLSIMQILLGFLLMTGLFVAPATYAIIPLYIIGYYQNPYLFGNIEVLGATIALLIVADSHPGIDDLVGIPFVSPLKKLKPYVPLILRLSLGMAIMYLAVWEKLLNPYTSALVAEMYHLDKVIPVSIPMWVFAAGVIEFLVGLAIVLGLRTRITAAVAVAVLSLSFFYFKEDVYSHITLFGVLSIIFVTGGGKLSLDEYIDPYFHLKLSPQKTAKKKKSKTKKT